MITLLSWTKSIHAHPTDAPWCPIQVTALDGKTADGAKESHDSVPKSPLQQNDHVSKLRPSVSLPVDSSTVQGELGRLATGRGSPMPVWWVEEGQ